MNSDHPQFDVEATIRVTVRMEAWNANQAQYRVSDALMLVEYNPMNWDDREIIGLPEIEIHSCEFFPQGTRTEEPGVDG
jgi:hypothetical protein